MEEDSGTSAESIERIEGDGVIRMGEQRERFGMSSILMSSAAARFENSNALRSEKPCKLEATLLVGLTIDRVDDIGVRIWEAGRDREVCDVVVERRRWSLRVCWEGGQGFGGLPGCTMGRDGRSLHRGSDAISSISCTAMKAMGFSLAPSVHSRSMSSSCSSEAPLPTRSIGSINKLPAFQDGYGIGLFRYKTL